MNRFLKAPDRILNSFSSSEQMIYKYLEQNLCVIGELSISEISISTYSSPASVFNVLKKLGYSGFKEFKSECREYANSKQELSNGKLHDNRWFNKITGMDAVYSTIENQSYKQFGKICEEIHNAKRILVIANEVTQYVAQSFAYRLQLCSLDINYSFDFMQYEILLAQEMYDYIIVFSKFGNTERIISAVEKNDRTIDLLICSNNKCYLQAYSNEVLFGHCKSGSIADTLENYGDLSSRIELDIISDMIINTYIYSYIVNEEGYEKI